MRKNYDEAMEIEKLKNLRSYRLVSAERIDEWNANLCVLEHNKTKARVIAVPNKDDNKVFNIGFRTPSPKSTGVAHIIEHTVLCGSKKFPAKDPFIELVKGSLNTFLNAMTFPDRTIYPVASVNSKDFQNLTEVYLDAVFFPNIYKEPKFFLQEGWRYHLKHVDDDLEYTGVVYNEMKGVYSGIDGILENAVNSTLYEGSVYGEDSGGNPDFIPDLTYEEFLDFHRKYYHPSNSFLYLYGDMDMAKKLEWIDKEYLSRFDYLEVDSGIASVRRFDRPREFVFDYPISENEDEENASCLSINVLTGSAFDPIRTKALEILGYVLIGKPGAKLKEALMDAGIGEEIEGNFNNGIKEPSFSIVAKNVKKGKKAEFLTVVKGTLQKICNEGLDKEELLATINVNEFRAREADFGSYPRGLIYLLGIMETWTYGEDPALNLRYEKEMAELRNLADRGYFEDLIREVFLDNPHEVMLTLNPVRGLAFLQEEKLREKLANIKANMSREELEALVLQTAELEIFQETPSTEEERNAIPLLNIEDIDREMQLPDYTVREPDIGGRKVKQIFLDEFTFGINYVRLMFHVNWISKEDLPLLGFFVSLLKKLDTKNHPYTKLSTLSNMNLGGLNFSIDMTQNANDAEDYSMNFHIAFKSLIHKTEFGLTLAKEIARNTLFTDIKRIRDIVGEQRANLRSQMAGSGVAVALNRAASGFSRSGYFNDATSGIRYLRFIEDLYRNFDERIDAVTKKLEEFSSRIFNRNEMLICVTSTREGLEELNRGIGRFCEGFRDTAEERKAFDLEKRTAGTEAFATSSKVNYVGLTGDFGKHGFEYHGAMQILKNLLNFDYLWTNIRVKGGAYGCSSVFTRSRVFGLSSYRDPNITNTYKVYEGAADYVKHLDLDERELRKSVIGVISQMDVPKTPTMKAGIVLSMYLQKVSKAKLQQEREEVLDATSEQIRSFYPMLDAVLKDAFRAVVGNEVKIKEEADAFDSIENLFGE